MYPLIETFYVQALAAVLGLLAVSYFLYRAVAYYKQALWTQRLLIDQVNHILPQTQCGQCGHKGCLPYARAIAQGEVVNKCPPGGDETIRELACLLGETSRPLDPAHGQTAPFSVAVIREDECIGCTKCIQACPVDAILGGPKLMHTVIERECTGCDLCVEPCPVDCIDMLSPNQADAFQWHTVGKGHVGQQVLGSGL